MGLAARLNLVAFIGTVVYYHVMTKREKLIEHFISKPRDFTWDELAKILGGLGYQQISAGKTDGSRVGFVSPNHPPIILHKPHPKPVLKRYQLEEIIDLLKQEKLL